MSVTFLSHRKYQSWFEQTKAGILIVGSGDRLLGSSAPVVIEVKNIERAKHQLIELFAPNEPIVEQISELAYISPLAKIQTRVSIGNYCVIKEGVVISDRSIIHDQVFLGKNVRIGSDCIIFPGVKIYENTRIGNRVIIHSNAVIGSDGFGYRKEEGTYMKLQHLGTVLIEDDVEIGSNTVIDKGTIGNTEIGKGVKLDNLIQVGHNVKIKENTIIAAQTGIAGSTTIERGCTIGGQVGLVGHIHVQEGSMIQAKSGLSKSITEKNTKWYGYPAIRYFAYLRSYSIFRKLPELMRDLRELKKDINKLKDRLKKKDI